MERIFSLHYAFMCRSGTQIHLPRRLPMSQVSLVDDHTLHQPCVQSLSFRPRLALWMPPHLAPFLWPTVAIAQRKQKYLARGRITSRDLPLRMHTHTHTHTHNYAYYMIHTEDILVHHNNYSKTTQHAYNDKHTQTHTHTHTHTHTQNTE